MIDLADIKAHCVVEHSDDDILLSSLAAAAVTHFEDCTGRKLVATPADLPPAVEISNELVINASIQLGCLMLVAHWYANREAVITGTIVSELPLATEHLWAPYRFISL